MAAQTRAGCVCLDHQLSHGRATKKMTQGALIERLRNKKIQNHSWNDSIKYVRSSVAERKAQIENTEPSGVQQCLDTLQKVITVKSQQNLKERLDLIGRHLGLNTQIQEQKVSLRTDTFQVDVLLGDDGVITSVRLANQGDVVECPDLKEILKKGDFAEFIEHLQGLQSIYQVTNDEKLKSKAFVALQALEKDLNQLAQFQSSISGVANYIHKCPLGIMLPRLAGKPMKLIYFVSPYDLLDKKSLAAHPLTVEAITENFLGQSVTVCIEPVPESAPSNKLQTMPLMNVNKTQDGKSLPSFSAVSKINSTMLPASFVLVLPQSIPVSTQILQKITSQTGLEIHKEAESRSLRSLILESFSRGCTQEGNKLIVSLPDQQHIYFLECLDGGCQEQQGLMVSRIPFTHPTHVPQILTLLRQQLLFNIVVGSCVRPGTRSESTHSIVFEVTANSLQQLTIIFEHPAYDSMIRVDIDLTDITNLKCKLACPNSDQLCSDEAISKVFHRCMSIPIMLRWLIGKGLGHLDKLKEAALAAERERQEREQFLKELKQQQARCQPTTIQTNRPPPQPPHPPPLPPPPSYPHYHSPVHMSHGVINSNSQSPALAEARGVLDELCHLTESNSKHVNDRLPMSPDTEHIRQSVLIPLLHEEELTSVSNPKEVHDAPMLSRLLDDNTSVATTVIPMNCKPSFMTCVKRSRKRKLPSDSSGPSPKHHLADGDLTERFAPLSHSLDSDMTSGLNDHNSPPVSRSMTATATHHAHHPMLNRAPARSQNNVIDLTEDSSVGESSLKRLSDLSMLFSETEAPSRIPHIRQNSPSGSKNENASTSLEGHLKGSGEVGRAKDFDPGDALSGQSSNTFSKLSSLLLATSESPRPCLSTSPHAANSLSFTGQTDSGNLGMPVSNSLGVPDIKPPPALLAKAGTTCQSSDIDITSDRKSVTGLFDKFDISRQQKNVKTEPVSNEVRSQLVEGKVSLRLKVGPLKQQNSMKPMVKSYKSVHEAGVYGKSNNIGTFDFKSDEDDDAPLLHLPSERYVYSSSPTCLQISSNQKQLHELGAIHHKSDKTKRKDRSSGNTTKRKREKDKSKRDKKKKKSEHFIQESVYRTVENDAKGDFKMKIRVKPMSDKSRVFSDGEVPSYEITKKPSVGSSVKLLTGHEQQEKDFSASSQVSKDKESLGETNSHKTTTMSVKSGALQKSSPKLSSSKITTGNSSGSRTDPKLVTKATIRLKPLTMPNSSSTVNIGLSNAKAGSAPSAGHKSERRNSASVTPPVPDKRLAGHNSLERRGSTSNLMDRRSVTQSSSSLSSSSLSAPTSCPSTVQTPSTPTSSSCGNLSLSSILPNAPTISKIASLPRIPKLSSSSSNTSISRTSSLDTVSEAGAVPAGTKSNNSYTVGPAGTKSNNSYTVGPAGRSLAPSHSSVSRPPGSNTAAAFNYSSRPVTPSNSNTGASGWSSFNANRPGSGHRQTSPLVNSNQAALPKPLGPRTPSLGGNSPKTGFRSTGSHKHSPNFTNNKPIKESTGSSSNPQKTFNSVAKSLSSSNTGSSNSSSGSSQVSGHFMGQKTNMGSANTAVQKHANPNTHSVSSCRTNSNTGSVSRSPNMSTVTKSPNSGKSPNITNPGRSPSVNSANRSPSLSSPNTSSNSVRSSIARPAALHRHAPGGSTSSHVHKGVVMKAHCSSTSQRTSTSHPGSLPTETTNVANPVSRPCPQTGLATMVAAAASVSAVMNPVGSVSGETSSVHPFPRSGSPSASAQKVSAAQPHATPSSSSLTTSTLSTSLKAVTVDQIELTRGDSKSSTVVEASKLLPCENLKPLPSPAAAISLAADGAKNRFNSFSRGRKSSLSAIVDKLKHSAVGGVQGSASLTSSPFPESPTGKAASFMGVESMKSSVHVTIEQDERTVSSQLPAEVDKSSAGSCRKTNHVFDGNHIQAVRSNEEMVCVSSGKASFMSQPGDTSADKHSVTVSSEPISNQGKSVPSMPWTAETQRGRDLSALPEVSGSGESVDIHLDGGRVKDTVPLLQHTLSSSHQESDRACGHSHLAASSSPFHPVQSPLSMRSPSPSPTIVSSRRLSVGLTEYNHHMFQVASTKLSSHPSSIQTAASECLDKDSLADKVSSQELRCSSRLSDSSHQLRDSQGDISGHLATTSSKPLSSPLSDISSPGTELVIDDEDTAHKVSLTPCKFSLAGNSIHKTQLSNSNSRQSSGGNSSQFLMETSVSGNNLDYSASQPSIPRTSPPPLLSAKSPTLAKYSSCASSSKSSDSPCPIDDDLMDVALGFGS